MSNYVASQKLWRVIKERDDYYYEIRLTGGIMIDRIKIEEPALTFLKKKGLL